ncbi:MAG: DUF1491 family protein [Rhizobiales bacterium]|nr:DUF1491 family protein [Hyphomicrobiales bacterium]
MRLKSEVWVQAYLRRVNAAGASAMLVRRGDRDAGAIYIKICDLGGLAWLFSPAPPSLSPEGPAQSWAAEFDGDARPEREVDERLAGLLSYDRDIWIIEVEDRGGRHFLTDWLN